MAKKILRWKGTARKKGTRKFKLEIELVPRTVFYSNVRELVPKDVWNKIRTEQYKKAGHRCEICGARGGLDCHERWEYDDEKHVQRLVSFAALCKNCHMIKHRSRRASSICRGLASRRAPTSPSCGLLYAHT